MAVKFDARGLWFNFCSGQACCSKFRYDSNGIFVLGVGFFSTDKLRLFNKPFLTKVFKYHSKDIFFLNSNLKRYFTGDDFS